MEEINLKDLWGYFINNLFVIIVLTLLGAILGAVYTLWYQTPMYKSSTTLVLTRSTNDKSENDAITSSDITLNQKLVSTYSEIIKSRRILDKVIDNLNLNTIYEDLYKKVTVTNVSDTELIKISVIDESRDKAREIANEVSDVFSDEIQKIYKIQNISIIDYGQLESTPYNVNLVKLIIICALVGFILACSIIFVRFYFDTTIKSAEEIEEKLGVVVLGRVPVSNKLRKKNKFKEEGEK